MLDLAPIKARDRKRTDFLVNLRDIKALVQEVERLRAELAGAKPPAYTYRVRICPHCEGAIVVGVPHACKGQECARCGAAKPCWCGPAGMA